MLTSNSKFGQDLHRAGDQPIPKGSYGLTCSTHSGGAGAQGVAQKVGPRSCRCARCAAASAQSRAGAASWGGGAPWERTAPAAAVPPVLAPPEPPAGLLQAELRPGQHIAPEGAGSLHLQPPVPADSQECGVSTASASIEPPKRQCMLTSWQAHVSARRDGLCDRHDLYTCGCRCCKLSCASMEGGKPKNGKPCGGHACTQSRRSKPQAHHA